MMKKFFKSEDGNPLDKKWNRALFMAIAFAAVVTSVVLLYVYFSEKREEQPHKVAVNTAAPAHISAADKIQEKLPQAKNQMMIPVTDLLTGKWFTTFGASSIAEITFSDDTYEIIYTDDPQGALRKYSRGFFKYEPKTGKLSLYASKDSGEPEVIPGVVYDVLTLRHYDVYLKQKADAPDLYFIAPEYTVATKTFHPLFLYADYTGAPVLKFSPTKTR